MKLIRFEKNNRVKDSDLGIYKILGDYYPITIKKGKGAFTIRQITQSISELEKERKLVVALLMTGYSIYEMSQKMKKTEKEVNEILAVTKEELNKKLKENSN